MKFKKGCLFILLVFHMQIFFLSCFRFSTILESIQDNNFDIMNILKNETNSSNKETREEQKVLSHRSNIIL